MPDLVVDELQLLSEESGLRIQEHVATAGDRGDEIAAQVIIAQLPTVLRAYAEMGSNIGPVMDLTDDDYEAGDPGLGEEYCSSDWLVGRARHVFDHCIAVGLNPTIVFKRNIERDQTCFAIVVDW